MPWIVFFDGECALCRRSARWLMRVDRHQQLSFASLDGDCARECGVAVPSDRVADSMVLLNEETGATFMRSQAVFELLRVLGWPWCVLRVFGCLPQRILDAGYDWVARHRHRWFGPATACALPDPMMRSRLRDGLDRQRTAK